MGILEATCQLYARPRSVYQMNLSDELCVYTNALPPRQQKRHEVNIDILGLSTLMGPKV